MKNVLKPGFEINFSLNSGLNEVVFCKLIQSLSYNFVYNRYDEAKVTCQINAHNYHPIFFRGGHLIYFLILQ